MMFVIGLLCCVAGGLFIGLGVLLLWLHRQMTTLLSQIPAELQSMAAASSPQATRAMALLRLLPMLRWVGIGVGSALIVLGWLVYPTFWFLVLIALAGGGLYSLRGQIEKRFSALLQQQMAQAMRRQL